MRKVQAALLGLVIVLTVANVCALLLTDNPYKDNPSKIFTTVVEKVGGE